MQDQTTVAISASQGHCASRGVACDMLPVAEDLVTAIHGETLAAAHSISHNGISKDGRLHIHFYESDLDGRPTVCAPPIRLNTVVIIVASAEESGRYGLALYKASAGAISTPGLDGFAPASCILCVRQLPSSKVQ